MLKLAKTNRLKNKKGMAVIEVIPVLFMLVLVFNFSLGFFGAVHSGILNSIGAYNYAFETFRYRSNLMYFRPGADAKHYQLAMSRVHGVVQDGSEQSTSEDKGVWPATLRGITFNYNKDNPNRNLGGVSESDRSYAGRRSPSNIWFATSLFSPDGSQPIQTPRIWIKTVYGICINAECTTDGVSDRQAGE